MMGTGWTREDSYGRHRGQCFIWRSSLRCPWRTALLISCSKDGLNLCKFLRRRRVCTTIMHLYDCMNDGRRSFHVDLPHCVDSMNIHGTWYKVIIHVGGNVQLFQNLIPGHNYPPCRNHPLQFTSRCCRRFAVQSIY
jgi:hypothetical protein